MSSSKLDCAQKFLNVAEQRYQEACDAKEIGDAKAVRRKIKEAKRVYRSAQQQRDFAAVVQAGISLSYLGATKIRYRGRQPMISSLEASAFPTVSATGT